MPGSLWRYIETSSLLCGHPEAPMSGIAHSSGRNELRCVPSPWRTAGGSPYSWRVAVLLAGRRTQAREQLVVCCDSTPCRSDAVHLDKVAGSGASRRDSGLGSFFLELKAELVSYTRKGSQWKGSIFVIVTVSDRASERLGTGLLVCAHRQDEEKGGSGSVPRHVERASFLIRAASWPFPFSPACRDRRR